MRRNIILSGMLLIAATFTACKGDYDDWTAPQANGEETSQTIKLDGLSASAVATVNLNNPGDSVQLFSINLPAGNTYDNTRIELTPTSDAMDPSKVTLNASNEGKVDSTELQAALSTAWGLRPVERTFTAHVYSDAIVNGQSFLADAGEITVTAIPQAPYISEHYYLIGAPSEWSPTCTTMPFSHNGGDVYENPEFTVTFPVSDGETWFAVIDDKTLESGEWRDVLGAAEGNGLNGMEGRIARRTELSDEGSWKVTVDGDAKYVKMTINMMDYTYKLEKINWPEFFYEIGNESTWGTSHALYGANGDGKYQGYYYLDGEFKFKPNADNWEGDYEYDGEGKLTQDGSANIPDPGAGFYQIDVDLTTNTYALTQVTSISAIGDFNGWGGDADLAYNTATGAWEAQDVNFATTGGVKFRMNHDWAVSWGGANGDDSNFGNLTQNNGQNLTVQAGTYDIQLFISYEGNNKVVLTKK